MENFINRLRSHIEHVKKVGGHCTTEETTKQALILPLLDILALMTRPRYLQNLQLIFQV